MKLGRTVVVEQFVCFVYVVLFRKGSPREEVVSGIGWGWSMSRETVLLRYRQFSRPPRTVRRAECGRIERFNKKKFFSRGTGMVRN